MSKDTTQDASKSLTVKQAVAKAMAAANEFYSGQGIVDLTLEEAEMSDDGANWLITLGFYIISKKPATALSDLMRQINGRTYEHRYKLFKVNARDGKVTSMKIRNV